MIDFLSLRAREYAFLTRMFQEWEVSCQQPCEEQGRARGELAPGVLPIKLDWRAWGFCNPHPFGGCLSGRLSAGGDWHSHEG